ncbi:MAG: tetratricopeptide repeat protein, partial [Pseudomonadota bacterium]
PEAALRLLARSAGRHDPAVIAARLDILDERGEPGAAVNLLRLEILRLREDGGETAEGVGDTSRPLTQTQAFGSLLSRDLAERLIHRGEIEAAGHALDSWLEIHPQDHETLLARADLALAHEGISAARLRLGQDLTAAGIEPDTADAMRLQAMLEITAGEHDEARALLRRAEARATPELPALILDRSLRWEQAGDRAAALETALAALLAAPDDDTAASVILRNAKALGRQAAASAALEVAFGRRDAPLPTVATLTVLSLRAAAGPSAAVDDGFTRLMERTGAEGRVAVAWARYLQASGRGDEAHRMLALLHRQRPGDTDLTLALGRLHLRRGEGEAVGDLALSVLRDDATRVRQAPLAVSLAAESLEQDLPLPDPVLAELRAMLPSAARSELELATAQTAPAIDMSVLRDAPGRDEGYLLIAGLKGEADPAAALGYLDAGVRACSTTLRLRLRRAGLLERMGRHEEALRDYAVMHAIAPHSLLVVNNFASLLAETSDEPAALRRAAELAARLQGYDVPEFLDTRGWIAARLGALDEGVALLRQAAEVLQDRVAVHYHLGLALLWQGETEEAREVLTRAVMLDTDARFRYYEEARRILAQAG